jgi:hypothetical protein
MIINLNNTGEVVQAKVTKNFGARGFMFAKNGEPTEIFCHINAGHGVRVKGDQISIYPARLHLPQHGAPVFIVRASVDPKDKKYTQAMAWFYPSDIRAARVQFEKSLMHRVIGYDHRSGGHFQGNSQKQEVIIMGTVAEIEREYPHGADNDPLGPNYSTSLLGTSLSRKNYWERLDPDGKWVEVGDPRTKKFVPVLAN